MRILVVSSQLSPLVRTGGLGDATAGLTGALAGEGHSVTVLLPRYRHLDDPGEPAGSAGPARALHRLASGSVEVLAVDDPPAFDREGIYGPAPGRAYPDEWWRWGRFSLVAAEVAAGYDLVHLQDGHAGPTALLTDVPLLLTIHNPAFPVLGPLDEAARLLGVGPEMTRPTAPLEWYGRANYLKAGAMAADRVTTVSPTFARQLTEEDDLSAGLGPVLRSLPHPVTGILNGIDVGAWDPARDPGLPARYSARDPSGKARCRTELLDRSGLDGEGTVFGMVGRMAEQKGVSLLDPVVDALVEEGFRLAAVGGGELEGMVDAWASRHPGVVWRAPYQEGLARLAFAGADAYLMPSRFEPCGLGQLYAMRYGTPPVVRLTGGLADTVVDVDEDPRGGTGFGFRPYLSEELAKTVRRAIRTHRDVPDLWGELRARGMEADWSWVRAARAYGALYREITGSSSSRDTITAPPQHPDPRTTPPGPTRSP